MGIGLALTLSISFAEAVLAGVCAPGMEMAGMEMAGSAMADPVPGEAAAPDAHAEAEAPAMRYCLPPAGERGLGEAELPEPAPHPCPFAPFGTGGSCTPASFPADARAAPAAPEAGLDARPAFAEGRRLLLAADLFHPPRG